MKMLLVLFALIFSSAVFATEAEVQTLKKCSADNRGSPQGCLASDSTVVASEQIVRGLGELFTVKNKASGQIQDFVFVSNNRGIYVLPALPLADLNKLIEYQVIGLSELRLIFRYSINVCNDSSADQYNCNSTTKAYKTIYYKLK